MMIKDLGTQVARIWEGLRPETKKLVVKALDPKSTTSVTPFPKYIYDAHADLELSRLLSALDERSKQATSAKDASQLDEISHFAEACAALLEMQSGSAEVFIQLAERAIRKHDYNKLDKLADALADRFSAAEIAEIVRQTELPQIRAIAYETLAMLPVSLLAPLLDDPLYAGIAESALEQKAFEFGSEEARDILEQLEPEPER